MILLGIFMYLTRNNALSLFSSGVFFAHLTFYLAYKPKGFLRKYNNLGDYSYGLYVYAFPVQQALMHFIPKITFGEMVIYATLISIPLALLSWHFIEQPSLLYARRFSLRNSKKKAILNIA